MRIEILNWAKFNPRKDVSSSSWFRLENNFWMDDAIWKLDSDGKMVWLMLLALASGKSAPTIDVDPSFVATNLRVSEDVVAMALEQLEAAGKISTDALRARTRTSRRRNADVTQASRERNADVPTDGRTDETDETDETTAKTQRRKKPPVVATEADLAVGSEWLAYAREEMPWKADHPKWTVERFGEELAKLRVETGLNDEGLRQLLAFVRNDKFWSKNAVSPAGLLKTSDRNGNRKIDNILIRMRTPTDRQADALRAWVNAPTKEGLF